MSSESTNAPSSEPAPAADDSGAVVAPATENANAESDPSSDHDARIPEFEEVSERLVARLDTNPERLHEVCVPVWAELGRVEMLIGDLLQLGEGTIVRLDRAVGDPVDLISQGVKLARGEVIVVDDCFAIRIRDIFSGK